DLNERRNLDFGAGFQRRWLGATGRTVTVTAWLGVLRLEFYGNWQLSKQRVASVERNLHAHGLHKELCCVAELLLRQLDLREVGVIHDSVAGAVVVRVSHIATVNGSGLDLGAGTPSLVGYLAGNNILELAAHESWALARL